VSLEFIVGAALPLARRSEAPEWDAQFARIPYVWFTFAEVLRALLTDGQMEVLGGQISNDVVGRLKNKLGFNDGLKFVQALDKGPRWISFEERIVLAKTVFKEILHLEE